MANITHKNDIGTIFRFTIKDQDLNIVNIASATTLSVLFTKPDNTVVTKTGVLYTNGTDGIVQYITISGDLNLIGKWLAMVKVVIGTSTWSSDTIHFDVLSIIE